MSVQDERGYWDSMSEQERNLSSLSHPQTKQDKTMSVKEEILKNLKVNPPLAFWRKSDGVKFCLIEDGSYYIMENNPHLGYTLNVLYRHSNFSLSPPSGVQDSISLAEQDKNMSVQDELIGSEQLLKNLKANPPIFFWNQDGAKFKRNSCGKYSRDYGDGEPPAMPENGFDLEYFHNNPRFSMFPREEVWKVRKDTIDAAISAIQDGLEFARETLVEHDLKFGRGTKKNKSWAETIEASIRHMELTLKLLKDCPEKLMLIETDEKMSPVTGSKISLFPYQPFASPKPKLTEEGAEEIKNFYEI